MLEINKENLNDVLSACIKSVHRSEYNDMCFSRSEVERNIEAYNCFARLCERLSEEGVDFNLYIKPFCDEFDIHFNENWSVLKKPLNFIIPENLNLKINCDILEYFFNQDETYLIKEGNEPPKVYENYRELYTNSSRFAYQNWSITDKSISNIKLIPKVKSTLDKSYKYIQGKELLSIEMNRDLYSDENSDYSEILFTYKDSNNDHIYIATSIGGYYEDITIANDYNLIDCISLKDENDESYRRYRTLNIEVYVYIDEESGIDKTATSNAINYDSFKRFIDKMKKYRDILNEF